MNGVVSYSDALGNEIVYDGPRIEGVQVHFRGENNRLVLDRGVKITSGSIFRFDCNNAVVRIGKGLHGLHAFMRLGEDASIEIGDNVTSTTRVMFCAVEGSRISLGNDVMISGDVQIRTDDEHPIFDVVSGSRVNPARPVVIGDHVWLGWGVRVLGGTSVGPGSVVGASALVKGSFTNNCIVAGVPARVIRHDIAWERDHLSLKEPFYKPDSSFVDKSKYWSLSSDL
ncbi:acyltransferase [Glutamicibacter soli]|uniref:acyltransferase n=1 Tax=Glutamicibacter soli TaxID=453836 RepID=UPI000DE3D8CA|nr:acyltransferase [Glutamicibacter soli]